jgi:hypothetical protein
MVSVSRTYYERGNSTAYSHDYFEEKSTVGKWRTQRRVSVTHSKWMAILETHRQKMRRLGMGYTVDTISDDIEISMVVPINQKDKRFGDRNSNLVGKAVRTAGLRVIETEAKIYYPLQNKMVGKTSLPNLDPMSLELNQSYKISKRTPLMPVLTSSDPLAELTKAKIITAGSIITIMSISELHSSPWYKVSVTDAAGTRLGSGWVNSIALLGQELEALQSKDDTENIERTKRVQRILSELGYGPGPVDGKLGPKTESAIRAFQRAHNFKIDGRITDALLGAMERANSSNDPDWELVEAWEGEPGATYFVLIDFNRRTDRKVHWRAIKKLCEDYQHPKSCQVHFNSSRAEAERFEHDSWMRSVEAMYSNLGNINELAFNCRVRDDENCF